MPRFSRARSSAVRARRSYQDFLSLWKQADADLPLLKEAHAEYDKLKD